MVKRLFSTFVAICLLFSIFSFSAFAGGDAGNFADMPEAGHWAHPALSAAVKHGILKGSGGYLRPSDKLTRAEMATIINNAFASYEKADISAFSDVSSSSWHANDIAKAVAMKSFEGDGKLMRPEDPITRQEAFTVLARVFKLEDGDARSLSSFVDGPFVAPWALGKVAALREAGYLSGSNGRINPLAHITRAEFAQVMHNMLQVYITEEGTYTELAAGNVMVNVPGVVLKGMEIKGDLIVGDGVGDGNLTLDNVKIVGRLVVRGGGENSIIIINKSNIGSIVVSKPSGGGVRVQTQQGCNVDVIYIDDGKDDVILQGEFNQVVVDTDIPVILRDAEVAMLSLAAEDCNVKMDGKTEVTAVDIGKEAAGSRLDIGKDSSVAALNSSAEGATIGGEGKLTSANVSGNNTKVNTAGTNLTVAENTSGVAVNGKTVPGGDTVVTAPEGGAGPAAGGGGEDVPPAQVNPTPFSILKDDNPAELGLNEDFKYATLDEALAKAEEIKGGNAGATPRITLLKDAVLEDKVLPAGIWYIVRGSNVVFKGNNKLNGETIIEGTAVNKGKLELLYNGTAVEFWVLEGKFTNEGEIVIHGEAGGDVDDSARLLVHEGTMINAAGGNVKNNGRFGVTAGGKLTNYGKIDVEDRVMFFDGGELINETTGVIDVTNGNLAFGSIPDLYDGDTRIIAGRFSSMDNKGRINNKSKFELNGGTYVNNGTIKTDAGAELILRSGIVVKEEATGDQTAYSVKSFSRTELTNASGAVFESAGTVDSGFAKIVNAGDIINNGEFLGAWERPALYEFCRWIDENDELTPEQKVQQGEDAFAGVAGLENGDIPGAEFINSGTFLNNAGGLFEHVSGKFENTATGTVTNNGEFNIDMMTLISKGTFKNYDTIWSGGSTFDISHEFHNEGNIMTIDRYYAKVDNRNRQTLGMNTLKDHIVGRMPSIEARVYSNEGLEAALEVQGLSTDNLDEKMYSSAQMFTSITISENTNFSYFKEYILNPNYDEGGGHPSTLKVEGGNTLTVGEGVTFSVGGWRERGLECSVVVDAGAAMFISPDAGMRLDRDSAFKNNGAVTNNGQIVVIDEEDENGDLIHGVGDVEDAKNIAGCIKAVHVTTTDGFYKAIAGDYDHIYVEGDVEIDRNTDINGEKFIYINYNGKIKVGEGKTLTLDGVHVANYGAVSVYGNLVLKGDTRFENSGTLEVGDLSGDINSEIKLLGNARLENSRLVKIYANGKIVIYSGATFAKPDGDGWTEIEGTAGGRELTEDEAN